MRRLLLVSCLLVTLPCKAGAIPVPQVPAETKGKHGVPEQAMEKAWGARAVEPPEDNQLGALLPVPEQRLAAAEKPPDAKAWVETKDILGRFRRPQQGPEPDLDSLYQPPSEEVQGEAKPWSWAMLSRRVLQGPEEDLDYIFHPVEGSRGP